jgi:hypothetical protein
MERMQSLHWHRVDDGLAESGVLPLRVEGLLDFAGGDRKRDLVATRRSYPCRRARGCCARARASGVPRARPDTGA